MAAATVSLKPQKRPPNLPKTDEYNGEVPDLAGTDRSDVFDWAESVRDAAQEGGEVLSPKGLATLAANSFEKPVAKKVVEHLKAIYNAAPSTNGNGKHEAAPKAGKTKAEKKEKKETAPPRVTSTPVKITGNKTTIPVSCSQSEGGRMRARVFEGDDQMTMRHFISAVAKKFEADNDQIHNLLIKMGLGNAHPTLRDSVVLPHAAAGRSGEHTYGAYPDLTPAQATLVKKFLPPPTEKPAKEEKATPKAAAKKGAAKKKAAKAEADEE